MIEILDNIKLILERLEVEKSNGSLTIHVSNGKPVKREIKIVDKI